MNEQEATGALRDVDRVNKHAPHEGAVHAAIDLDEVATSMVLLAGEINGACTTLLLRSVIAAKRWGAVPGDLPAPIPPG
jgi:hypothetical protein